MRPWLAPILIATVACTSNVEEHLKDGADALADCDVRAAHAAFSEAYEADSSNARAALGFALTDLALLPEDPAVTAVLRDIGFSAGLDMQLLVFGADGALARYARGDTCDSIDAFLEANVPYPPVSDSTIDAVSLIRADMTAGDLVSAARTLEPRLGRIAAALVTAAAGATEPVEIEGGCGLGELTFQKPELLGLAALLEAARSMTALASAYDWDINVALLVDQSSEQVPALVDSLNQHLGHVVDATAAEPAGERTRAALGHLAAAAVATTEIGGPVAGGLFDWSLFPVTLATELAAFADSLGAATEGPAALAGVAPALEIDASALLSAEVDLGAASAPIFAVGSDEFGNVVTTDGEALAEAFAPVFAPAPWSELAPAYTWRLGDELEVFDGDPVVEPARRYTGVFSCMTDPGL